jgi:hypothetical protein
VGDLQRADPRIRNLGRSRPPGRTGVVSSGSKETTWRIIAPNPNLRSAMSWETHVTGRRQLRAGIVHPPGVRTITNRRRTESISVPLSPGHIFARETRAWKSCQRWWRRSRRHSLSPLQIKRMRTCALSCHVHQSTYVPHRNGWVYIRSAVIASQGVRMGSVKCEKGDVVPSHRRCMIRWGDLGFVTICSNLIRRELNQISTRRWPGP